MTSPAAIRLMGLLALLGVTSCGKETEPPAIPGTYVLDTVAMEGPWVRTTEERLERAIAEALPQDRPRLEAALTRNETREMRTLRAMAMEWVLREDGTWRATASMGEDGPRTAAGTWQSDGDSITFTATHRDGEARKKPVVSTGICVNGVIRINPAGDYPTDLVLRRK